MSVIDLVALPDDSVLVKDVVVQHSKSALYVPEDATAKVSGTGELVRGSVFWEGDYVKKGLAYFGTHVGRPVELEGERYRVLKKTDVILILKPKK